VLGVVHDHRLFAPRWHEDLDGFVVIAVGAVIERTLNALGCYLFAGPYGVQSLRPVCADASISAKASTY
jgi:hypothetical protein